MSQLLSPAIALMNRLRYPQKFLLISLLFILPLALVMALLIAEVNTKADFAQKEEYGTEYLRAVRTLFEDALHQQATAHAYMNDVARSFNTVAGALISSSAYRQAVVDNAVDGIITIGGDGRIDSVNPAAARIFGYATGEITGQPIQQLIPAPHDQQYQIVGIGREVVGRRSDGTEFPLDLAVGEMRLGDQHRYIAIAHDLTERKRAAEEQARLQERIIQAQAAALAELSTPLIPISDHVVVMPLIGAIDTDRANQVLETLLLGIERSRARVAILDITGVPLVDSQVAKNLLVAAQAVRLL